jgi:hypothetical protein
MGKAKLRKSTMIRKLIQSFPSAIVANQTVGGYVLDYDETLANFAERVIDTMAKNQIKNAFGDPWETEEEFVHFMETQLDGLREACEEWVSEHYDESSEL